MTQDLTTYTELDPNSRLSRTTTTETFTGLARNESAGAWGAYTSGENFYAEGKFNIASATGAATASDVAFSFSDTASVNTQANVNSAAMWLICSTASTPPTPYAHLRESSTASSTAGTALAFATDYWYRSGVCSALGRYGAVVAQVFSDSGMATCLQSLVKVRTAAKSYDYHYSAQSTNLATAGTITGTHADITLSQPAAGIDLTTGVETDTGTGRLEVYPDCIVATALNIANSETAKHVAIDHGAAFFGDYKISGVLNVTAFASGTTAVPMFAILSVTDAAADARASNDLQGVNIYWLTSTTYAPYIHQSVGGTDTVSTAGPTLNTNQPYSFVLERSGTTLTLKVWNDLVLTNFAGTSQVGGAGGTVTWTGRATTTYRYSMPVASTLNGATSRSSTFTLGGVVVGVAGTGAASGDGVATSSIVGASLIAASSLSGDGVATGLAVGASVAEAVTSGVGVATGAAVGELFSAGSAAASGTGVGTGLAVGASTWAASASGNGVATASGIGSGTIPISYTAYIMCRITKQSETTGMDEPATGLTPTVNLFRTTDLYSMDFSDSTFKADASCISISANMTPKNATYHPGWYIYQLSTYGLGVGAKTTYVYSINASISSSQAYYNEGSMIFLDGIEVLPGLTVAENTTLNVIPSAVLTAAQTTPIHADIQKVISQSLTGDGSDNNPWNPV